MKKIIYFLALLPLTAWGADNGNVKATMADKQYQSSVKCVGQPGQKYFEFMSDMPESGIPAGGLKDINGDGLLISGWLYNARLPDGTKELKFGLKIIENDVEFMSMDLKSWEKTANGVAGSGELKKQQDDFASFPATFEVSCK
jgi:hypothetical protein